MVVAPAEAVASNHLHRALSSLLNIREILNFNHLCVLHYGFGFESGKLQ